MLQQDSTTPGRWDLTVPCCHGHHSMEGSAHYADPVGAETLWGVLVTQRGTDCDWSVHSDLALGDCSL